jgi:predicted 3-demethylubiquinone-9 3-methyltransferase (glyoxalase superfamily)
MECIAIMASGRQGGCRERVAGRIDRHRCGSIRARGDDTSIARSGEGMQKITPFLWYAKEAEEAARFYCSIFPDSRIVRVSALQSASPSGPPGSVRVVDFILSGQQFRAMSAGPLDPFNHAISLQVDCDDQAEIDRYWNALLDGGHAEQCGWLKDRFGVSWQIVPKLLAELMSDPDHARSRRVSDAMLKMVKIDIAGLRAADEAR